MLTTKNFCFACKTIYKYILYNMFIHTIYIFAYLCLLSHSFYILKLTLKITSYLKIFYFATNSVASSIQEASEVIYMYLH